MRNIIKNPVIRGFSPDPSIVLVGEDFYLATSTFQWHPPVQIYHSRDLSNWRSIDNGLGDANVIKLQGVPDSGGIWAPSLSWNEGLFYLTYTVVVTAAPGRAFKDTHNYLITSNSISGPWSSPIHLNSSGFDPSLFHDTDGRKWFLNMLWDHRKTGLNRFQGIIMQEYDFKQKKLTGPVYPVLKKKTLIEGPNIYKLNGFYYLMVAEGGTGYDHSVSISRSRSIIGPYENDPQEYVLTSRFNSKNKLQKAGHGELLEVSKDNWIMVHLASRPMDPNRRCVLGRESCIQKVYWTDDGWLRLNNSTVEPNETVECNLPLHPWPSVPDVDDFNTTVLGLHWCSLRSPISFDWLQLNTKPGWLRIAGRESLFSLHNQSLIARRLTNFEIEVETRLNFNPVNILQSAGLIFYYDTSNHIYLRVTFDEIHGKVLGVVYTDNGNYIEDEKNSSAIIIKDWDRIFLRGVIKAGKLQFYASCDSHNWLTVHDPFDASILSDDYGNTGFKFTGTFCGMAVQDLSGQHLFAEFDYFLYREL
jgi:xylan 1,4-beta-xylosidase